MYSKVFLGLVVGTIVFCMSGVVQASIELFEVGAVNTGTNIGVDTGISIIPGDRLIVSCDPLDTWSSRPGDTHNAEPGNLIHWWTYNGLSEWVGTLVGQIGDGNFFSIGLDFDQVIQTEGNLKLYNFDGIWQDNSGSVTAAVEVIPVPEPASLLLICSGLVCLGRFKNIRPK